MLEVSDASAIAAMTAEPGPPTSGASAAQHRAPPARRSALVGKPASFGNAAAFEIDVILPISRSPGGVGSGGRERRDQGHKTAQLMKEGRHGRRNEEQTNSGDADPRRRDRAGNLRGGRRGAGQARGAVHLGRAAGRPRRHRVGGRSAAWGAAGQRAAYQAGAQGAADHAGRRRVPLGQRAAARGIPPLRQSAARRTRWCRAAGSRTSTWC